jgi:hypothetical protein
VFKILSSDPNDQIVSDLSSLKTGIGNRVFQDYVSQYIPTQKGKQILEIILNDSSQEYTDFFKSMSYVITKIQTCIIYILFIHVR